MSANLIIRRPGRVEYQPTVDLMQQFTAERDSVAPDEIWLLEHPPVFTLGTNADPAHVIDAGDTPLVQTDRGGQVTWHGPGQLVAYLLLDIKRLSLTVKSLVHGMEAAIIAMLKEYGIEARCRAGAPGVYVGEAKIASLGIRVRRGLTYHGLAINVCNDADGFQGINPCGYDGLETVRIADYCESVTTDEVADKLLPHLLEALKHKNSVTNEAGWPPL